MSTRAKWIWAIVILVIIVVLGAAAFTAGRWFGGERMLSLYDGRDRDFYHMMPFDRFTLGFRSPLGWLGMGLGMLLMWGLPLGFLALAVIGAVSLIRGSGTRKQDPASTETVERPVATPLSVAATTVLRECESCGKPAQADWKTCPYCGTPLG